MGPAGGEAGEDSGGAPTGGTGGDPSADLPEDNLWNPVTRLPSGSNAQVLALESGEFVVFDSFQLEGSLSSRRLTLLRYAANGNYLGHEDVFETNVTAGVGATVVGTDNDIFACGSIGSSVSSTDAFPGQNPSGRGDAFVVRLDAQGRLIWARQFAGENSTLPNTCVGLAVDSHGNSYYLDTTAHLHRLNPDGELDWAVAMPASNDALSVTQRLVLADSTDEAMLITTQEVDAAVDPLNTKAMTTRGRVTQVGIHRFGSDGELLSSTFHNIDQRSTGKIAVPLAAAVTREGEALFLSGNTEVIAPLEAAGTATSSFGSYLARFDDQRELAELRYPLLLSGPIALSDDGTHLFQASVDENLPHVLIVRAWKSDLSEVVWETATELITDDDAFAGGPPASISVTSPGNVVVTQRGSSRGWAASHYRGSDGELLDGRVRVLALEPKTPPRADEVSITHLPVEALRPLIGVRAIAGPCALVEDGTVWCWGSNAQGLVGLPSDVAYLPYALRIEGIENAVSVHQNDTQACAVLADGTVQCWGITANGGLGNPLATGRIAPPIEPQGLEKVLDLSMGNQATCAVVPDLRVECWGVAVNGALGDRSITDDALVPEILEGVSGAHQVSVSASHACVHDGNKRVTCWGHNVGQALGIANGRLGEYYGPENPIDFDDAVLQVSAVHAGTCVLLETGRVHCWGAATNGPLEGFQPDGSFSTVPLLLPFEDVRGLIHDKNCLLQPVTSGSDRLRAVCWGGDFAMGPDYEPVTFEEFGDVVDFDVAGGVTCALGPEGTVSCSDGALLASPGDGFVLLYARRTPSLLYAGDPTLLE